MSEFYVVTVDGPSGVGKGTLSLHLAQTLHWHFLDSGALYRILAYQLLSSPQPLSDEQQIAELARSLDIRFENGGILLDKHPLDPAALRTEICGQMASRIAVFALVRAALLSLQRTFKQPPGLVADGRDMGTVVFPEAILKVFLTASLEERAHRRYLQLKEAGVHVTLESLLAEIKERDLRDTTRAIAPLKPAIDAMVIDTTQLGREAVFETVLAEVKRRLS